MPETSLELLFTGFELAIVLLGLGFGFVGGGRGR